VNAGINHEGFAALLALREGEEERVRQTLRTLPQGEQSPFAQLSGTHFARLTLVPPLRDRNDRPASGLPFCLFFAAEFDMLPGGYLESLCTRVPGRAEEMFGRCIGFPGTGAPAPFVSWMLDHRVRAGFSAHGYPGATAGEVERCLELRDRIIAFALDTRNIAPDALRERWAQEEWGLDGTR
jgi:hypothetical protein